MQGGSEARRVYLGTQILSCLAQGAWRATYNWFLFVHLGLGAAEMALVLGAQFVVQILLEIPTGTWADREDTGNILAFAYLGYLGCALIYVATGALHLEKSVAPSIAGWVAQNRGLAHSLSILGAGLAEFMFGIASAFCSGALDSWLIERERAQSEGDEREFKHRVTWAKSVKYLCGLASAVTGLVVAMLVLRRGWWPLCPWFVAAAIYCVTLLWLRRQIQRIECKRTPLLTTLRNIAPWNRASFERVARHSRRAFSYLAESPSMLWIMTQSAFVYVLFWINQAFWLLFPLVVLGLDVSLAYVLPLWAAIWVAGECAQAGGAALSGRFAASKAESPGRYRISAWLGVFAIGAVTNIASTALGEARFLTFAAGYATCKLAEGVLRSSLETLMDRAIVSERATHQSIDSFVKAVVGIIGVAAAGYLFDVDPVNGLVLLLVASVAAGVVFALCPFKDSELKLAPKVNPPVVGRRVWVSLGSVVVLLLTVLWLPQQGTAGWLWAALRGPSVVVSYAGEIAPDVPLTIGGSGPPPPAGQIWDISLSNKDGWGERVVSSRCEIVNFEMSKLSSAKLEGVSQVRAYSSDLREAVSFDIDRGAARVTAATGFTRPFQCWPSPADSATRLRAAPLAVQYRERIPPRTGSLVALLIELFAAAAILSAIFLLGNHRALRVVMRAQQLTPAVALTHLDGDDPRSTSLSDIVSQFGPEGIDLKRFKHEISVEHLLIGCVCIAQDCATSELWILECPRDGSYRLAEVRDLGWLAAFIQSELSPSTNKEAGSASQLSTPLHAFAKEVALSVPLSGRGSDRPSQPATEPGYAAWASAARRRGRDNIVGFAFARFENDRAPRYIDPIDRILLRMLADVSCAQHVLFGVQRTSMQVVSA